MIRRKLVYLFTLAATNLSKILLKKRPQLFTIQQYANMQRGSLGKSFHQYITKENISFQPNLIRHDLKHILLGYEMKLEDEIRLNAFLIGNKSYNVLAVIYLSVCLLLLPEMWKEAKNHYQKGKVIAPLKNVKIQKLAVQDLTICRALLNIPKTHKILCL